MTALSRTLGRPATLADFPDDELDRLAERGFDWLWLLGVWQTGPAGRDLARAHRERRGEWLTTLADLDDSDICGSCFAVTGYAVSEALGGNPALASLRQRMNRRGLRLMLDFIPNHTALDHPWVEEHPDFYVQANERDLARLPGNYVSVRSGRGSRVLAHGRDPHFPGWPDTLQLDYGNPALREAMSGELLKVAEMCDGLRCDMAMLVLPEVFERTWGVRGEPFWPVAIPRVRRVFPDFLFLAEVYWDLEWTLQQQGFDFTYDKTLYDRLRRGEARPIAAHLRAGVDFQSRLARFLENHDEPRVAAVFPSGQHRAAAVLAFLSPGLRFFHQGQLEGYRKHVPVELCRGPREPVDSELDDFYQKLLAVLRRRGVREGEWQLLPSVGEASADSSNFIAFAWQGPDAEQIWVAVNYAPYRGQCAVRLPFAPLAGRRWRLTDLMSDTIYEREGSELLHSGLHVDLEGWGYHVFQASPGLSGTGAGPARRDST